MAAYRLGVDASYVVREADGASIPADLNNADWRIYQAWLLMPNVPDPYVAPALDPLNVDTATAKAYPKLVALMGMTPAQVQAWVTANVNTLADAKDALMTLAIAVSILSRRL